MQRGFPLELLPFVRCSGDAGVLTHRRADTTAFLPEGRVQCTGCGREFTIHDGILSLLGAGALHPESAFEMRSRDAKNAAILSGSVAEWTSAIAEAIEVTPTLGAVGAGAGMTVLELGCGAGRYTLALADAAASVIAIDFSRPGLLVTRAKLAPTARVGLVQADVTKPYAAPRAFDRVLSTLHSNLPGRTQRMAALRLVAEALVPEGRAVISMHHYSGRDAVMGVPAEGRYADSGIFRYHMKRSEAVAESLPFFGRLQLVHISAGVPGLRSVAAARAAARIPLVRSALARLFLAVSEAPKSGIAADAAASRMPSTPVDRSAAALGGPR